MKGGNILLVIGLAFLTFEVCEHVIFPLVWSWKMRRQPPLTGLEAMQGKRAQVLYWDNTSGVVQLEGERWKAQSETVLPPGDMVRITGVRSLTLTVVPVSEENNSPPIFDFQRP
ncbi:MAG: NfeD family protein [Desulfosoma sp.]|uniref:NfeD family protein n=1 Tax=Desulfosoma sp. TaxID=2603217 RepID=UPI004049FB6F